MRLFLFMLIVMSSGCSLMEPKVRLVKMSVPVTEIIEPSVQLRDLMDYFSRLQNKTALELAWEYNYANSHYRSSDDPLEQLMFLMLLLQADTKYFDVRMAAKQLEQTKSSHELSPDLLAFSNILDTLLQQQITAKREIQQLSMQLNASRTEINLLKQRIEAIKNLERNLIRRNGLDTTDHEQH